MATVSAVPIAIAIANLLLAGDRRRCIWMYNPLSKSVLSVMHFMHTYPPPSPPPPRQAPPHPQSYFTFPTSTTVDCHKFHNRAWGLPGYVRAHCHVTSMATRHDEAHATTIVGTIGSYATEYSDNDSHHPLAYAASCALPRRAASPAECKSLYATPCRSVLVVCHNAGCRSCCPSVCAVTIHSHHHSLRAWSTDGRPND